MPVNEGGPVHTPSIQMLHATNFTMNATDGSVRDVSNHEGGENPRKRIGGTELPALTGATSNGSDEKIVSFQGDILEAASLVESGQLDRGTCFSSF